jgi:hypothetical protein
MHFLQRRSGCNRWLWLRRFAGAAVAYSVACVAAQAQDAVSAPVAQPLISEVQVLPGEPAGTRIIAFDLDAPQGTKFFVWWTNTGLRGASSTGPVWEKSGAEPVHVKITIEYSLNFGGDRRQNVLLSGENALQFRFEASGGVRQGLTGLASAPLFSLDSEARQIDVITSATDRLAFDGKGQRRLLFATPKSEIGKPADAITPRTELVVGTYIDPPARRPPEINQLRARWSRQPGEVGSAHIKFQLHRGGPGSYLPLKPEEVEAFIDEADLENRPENFTDFLGKVLVPERRGRLTIAGEFLCLGLKTHDRTTSGFERFYDGELDLRRMGNQVDVVRGDGSRVHRITLTEFRRAPGITDVTSFHQELKPPGQLVLTQDREGRRLQICADWATGFVRRESFFSGGELTSDVRQFAPQRYHGGIVFPKLSVRIRYRDGEMNTLELISLDHAAFNEALPADAFKFSAAAGTLVIVHDEDQSVTDLGTQIRITEPVADLAAFLRQRSAAAPPK